MLTKDQTAQFLADAHFRLDQGVSRVFRVLESDEKDDHKPLKLLEVNEMTSEAGIMPIAMPADPGRGIDYFVVVIEVSPGEFERLNRGELQLPHGWTLVHELFARQRAARAAS